MGKATGPTFIVPYRRRRENKTNFQKRLALIKADAPRLVVRATNKSIIAQIIKFDAKGDITLVSANSAELESKGWLAQANTPTAYLTGILVAKKALSSGIKQFHLDIGMANASKGRILFATAIGAKSCGIQINVDDELVDQSRLRGVHISEYAKNIESKDKSKYDKLFSRYTKKKIDVKNLPAVFDKTREALMSG
jgi:large subunit ribosomal protein L18